MKRFQITPEVFALLIEEHRIGLAYWEHSQIWTAGCRDERGEYRQVEARNPMDAVESLARELSWIDWEGHLR